ncbi:sister chromatid cohesion C-terminus-domain-containing protein, partial [Leucosporidium creatinivorum]
LLEALPDSHLADLGTLQAQEISGVCESITSGIPLVSNLVLQEEMSEDIVISAIYFSLSPYFHEEAPQAGKGKKVDTNVVERAMKGIRMASLGLTRTIYARYSDQRGWIIEEVLGNLTKLEIAKKGKGAFRLRNGAAIHTVSALILHLVQTAPANLRAQINAKILEHGKPKLVEEDVEMHDSQQDELEVDNEEETTTALTGPMRDLLQPAIESANQSARMVVNHLLQKSCKSGKAASGSTEAEYRAVFDNLITDLLSTLHLPEWPAAELILTVCCKSMMSSLADPKSTHELNALKGLSLDHVGSIAARIRHDCSSASHWPALQSLPEIVGSGDVSALEQLYTSQQQLFAHLVRTDKAEGASEFVAAVFGGELANALSLSNSILSKYSDREQNESEEGHRAKALNTRLSTLAASCWSVEVDDDIFGPSADDEQPAIDGIALQLARSRPLAALYEPLLDNIVNASDSSAVGFRTKALRDIGLVVAQDPELFHQANVRKSIESRMHDSSPAVRDAAIELVGKYVVSRPDLASEYLPQICERITDTGLSVRRRVVKLLKALFSVVEHEHERVEICRKLVWRAIDDDEGIKELAVETVEELWFSRTLPSATRVMVNDESQAQEETSKSGIAQLASIIMSVAGEYRDRPPPVDELLRAIISKHAEKGTKPPVGRLREVIETLIDSLVEDEETKDLVTTIKTIHVLNAADLGLLSASKAQSLIPFLKSASTPQDQLISDYLLKIFRSSISSMPKSNSKMGKELQAALTPMINKPPPSLATLQEIVACFCAVILGQTHDFSKLISFFRTTTQRLAGELRKLLDPATQASANIRALPTLCHLASLLCENGLFDSVRAKYPETKPALDSISPKPISEYIYTLLVKLYSLPVGPQVQSSALNSLGFLFRAYPTLMLNPSSTTIMDSVFKTGTPQLQLQLLKILQDFLTSQAKASTASTQKAEKGVKIDELVGNVDGFADSGVASAVSQRYIDQILSASVSVNPQVQRVAVDILTSVARSGFSHPLAISPTLVALTTSADHQIASKGYATLSLLHQKHASLLATRFAEPAKTAHSYARAVAGQEVVHGYRDDPVLSHFGRWYSLLQKEKRTLQHDYLKTLSRMFEMEPGAPCSEDDVSLARYVAEALSTLEFKRLEEPMIIISYLNSALAVAGLQVLHLLE